MKSTHPSPWRAIALIAALAGTAFSQTPVMRDAATHGQLVAALRQADQSDPMKTLPVSQGADPSVLNRPKDLISQSDIISFRGIATLVPKRAILQIPKAYGDRVAMQPGTQIVGWADFFAINRGWITTVEVSRTQAEGNVALTEETHTQMTKSGNLVVATYLGGPISVLPLKQSETTTTTRKP